MSLSVWQSASPLPLSPSEQTLLEAVAASPEIPRSVRLRAQIILSAAEGVSNNRIAKDLSLTRPYVQQWRNRFLAAGIRGLWNKKGVPPRKPVPASVEQAVLFDCLYRPRETALTNTVFSGLPIISLAWVQSDGLSSSHQSRRRVSRRILNSLVP